MLALVILAVPLEHTYGPLRIFAIFLSAGAALDHVKLDSTSC
jgi:membrane associated rhomboid family serine protease